MLSRTTLIENIEEMSASELIDKIEQSCSEKRIDMSDCHIQIVDKKNLEIISNEKFWPDEY